MKFLVALALFAMVACTYANIEDLAPTGYGLSYGGYGLAAHGAPVIGAPIGVVQTAPVVVKAPARGYGLAGVPAYGLGAYGVHGLAGVPAYGLGAYGVHGLAGVPAYGLGAYGAHGLAGVPAYRLGK